MSYCASRFHTVRRPTLEVMVGAVGVGGSNPIRIQSMTTSDTQDIEATVRQSIALAEVGCEIVRITAPNVQAAKCLREIRARFTAAGFGRVPLVADIHFLPSAAMEAVEHVEKVRVNPGNYADKKRFAVREYSDADYDRELQRLHEAFSPLVRRCRELGRALRIGTNHGSLSDRIMNRYGDTPLGMVESALEFLRIAESHGFRQTILSMKASNPKVMIEAYRLLVERMQREAMHYPLHLGVTEAGDGEDGRIKGAIGIGSLLLDGLGDTIRVSLTEDSVYEIPVAQAIAAKAMSLWPKAERRDPSSLGEPAARGEKAENPRRGRSLSFRPAGNHGPAAGRRLRVVGPENPPRVVVRGSIPPSSRSSTREIPGTAGGRHPARRLLLPIEVDSAGEIAAATAALGRGSLRPAFVVLELAGAIAAGEIPAAALKLVLLRRFRAGDDEILSRFAAGVRAAGGHLACDIAPADLVTLGPTLRALGDDRLIFTVGSFPVTPPPGEGGSGFRAPPCAWAPTAPPRNSSARSACGRPSGFATPPPTRSGATTASSRNCSRPAFSRADFFVTGWATWPASRRRPIRRGRCGFPTTCSRAPARGSPRPSSWPAPAAGGPSSTCRRRPSASARRPGT